MPFLENFFKIENFIKSDFVQVHHLAYLTSAS